MSAPRIFKNVGKELLSEELFTDIRLDKIVSKETAAFLRSPCSSSEIPLRQELFSRLRDDEFFTTFSDCLESLKEYRRFYELSRSVSALPEKYYIYVKMLASYVESVEKLGSLHCLGELCCKVSEHFSSPEMMAVKNKLAADMTSISEILAEFKSFVLAVSNCFYVTPDTAPIYEYEKIADIARNMGFKVSDVRSLDTRMASTLSSALCELYSKEISYIGEIIERHGDVDFNCLIEYVPEFEFYYEINTLVRKASDKGVSVCFPRLSDTYKYEATDVYDVSLFAKKCDNIVPNDTYFTEDEPFFFLTGANGGGKTTYLRAVGINLVLFLSGCSIFAKSAEIYPFTKVFSHFPVDERFDGVGRLDEEYRRAEELLEEAADDIAFFLFNETFSGTDEGKGFTLLSQITEKICEKKHFGVYVTHFHKVSESDVPILSAVVDESDKNARTFRIEKAKGNGSSYALDILKKYRLDKRSLQERL